MTSRSSSAVLALFLAACTPKADEKPAALPPPTAAKAAGKSMLTTHGYIHPDDPPGTWRASRPHHHYIEPCSDWTPNGPPITDEYNKAPGPKLMYLSWTEPERPGFDTVTASTLRAEFGEPHPGTKSVVVGRAAPLGPHWTWTIKGKPGGTFIAEALPDGSVRYHYAEIGHMAGVGNSAAFLAECLVERYGTPGWSFDPPVPQR